MTELIQRLPSASEHSPNHSSPSESRVHPLSQPPHRRARATTRSWSEAMSEEGSQRRLIGTERTVWPGWYVQRVGIDLLIPAAENPPRAQGEDG